ncbi:MAG: ATP synthase subunit I [Aliivibrio sp.]|uniref:ATP synthase subunit I n=1 Tax=Aliivibrio sp. TaxID=1872443 RepID=UPI001A448379|nr:ATP synthase subunit I [Aliivibrio sp.]
MLNNSWAKGSFVAFLCQIIIVIVFAMFLYHTRGEIAGISAILGGLVYCGPTLLANLFMSKSSDNLATAVVAKAYLGTIYKMAVSICLFIYIFKYISINIAIFLAAYVIALLTQYATSYVFLNRN